MFHFLNFLNSGLNHCFCAVIASVQMVVFVFTQRFLIQQESFQSLNRYVWSGNTNAESFFKCHQAP